MSLAHARESDDRRGSILGRNLEVELKTTNLKLLLYLAS
jgi:hypothetical protein